MAELTFHKDIYIVLILAAAFVIHAAAAAAVFFVKNEKTAQILNTGLTILNIFLHIFLIWFMMYRGISLEEAVLVIMISVFFHTLLYFIYYTAASYKKHRSGGEAK